MATAELITRWITFRDERGKPRSVRIEASSEAEIGRIERLYARIERQSASAEQRWHKRHTTFTDAGMAPGAVKAQAELPASKAGYPWEGPVFSFAYLLGESPIWSGPASLWLEVPGPKGSVRYACRFCAHLAELPITAACLNCTRTGRDRVIPKGAPRTTRKKLPVADGLKGGLGRTG